jgi:Calcium binding
MPKIIERAREKRIADEILVDAYDEEEKALGWYYHLEQKISFPFLAKCVSVRATSPLEVGDEVEAIGMAPEEECKCEMFVEMRWGKRPLAVPLSQLQSVKSDKATKEAIGDWHYWVKRGYQF